MAKYYDYYEDGEKYICSGTIEELAQKTGMSEYQLKKIVFEERGMIYKELKSVSYVGDTVQYYAFYKNGQFVTSGTLDELVDILGIKRGTLLRCGTPAYYEKYAEGGSLLIKMDGEYGVKRNPRSQYDREPVMNHLLIEREIKRLEELKIERKEKTNETVTIKRRISPKPFSFKNDWINYQLENMFRGWNCKKDVEKA